MKKIIINLIIIFLLCYVQIQAATIVGGSNLLSQSYANQLETWLGEGSITITNIYTKQSTDTAANFHNAVDGQGRTFSIIYVTGQNNVIGGYNPTSWDTSSGYRVASNSNAFVFNLTISQVRYHSYQFSTYETYNNINYGPTFGNGHDIYVNSTLNSGYTYSYAYRSSTRDGIADDYSAGYPYGLIPNGSGLTIGDIEVFTITEGTPVPEPGSYLLFLLGIILVTFYKNK